MKIVINRPNQFVDKIRAYQISVDGKKVSEIKSGEEITVIIPEHAKILHASVDWGLSNEIDISKIISDDKLTVSNSFSHINWIPFVALYYATFARKKYLTLVKS